MHINQLTGIPCIDIIQQDIQNRSLFWSDWHTHADKLDAIDKQTLESVGQTVTQVIYNLNK
jgi:aminopeptidase-like protein